LSKDGEEPRKGMFAGSLIGGLIGSVAFGAVGVAIYHSWPGSLKSDDMHYQDLAAVLLAAVAVIVTVFGVMMAVLAIWGYTTFRGIAKKAARKSAQDYVKRDVESGTIGKIVEALAIDSVNRYMDAAMGDQGKLRLMLESRLDRALFESGGSGPRSQPERGPAIDPDEDTAAIADPDETVIDPDEGSAAIVDPDDPDDSPVTDEAGGL
jgi:hypothetical protein